jgi:hypothetical protein
MTLLTSRTWATAVLLGDGHSRTWSFEQNTLRFHRWPDTTLTFHVIVTEITPYASPVRLEHDDYAFHLMKAPQPLLWRYDLHEDDHHGLGTRFHYHWRREDNVRPSGEVDPWDIMMKVEQEFGS